MAGPSDMFGPGERMLRRLGGHVSDIGNKFDKLNKIAEETLNTITAQADRASGKMDDLGNSVDGLTRKAGKADSAFKRWGKVLDSAGKGLLAINSIIIGFAFDTLIKGVTKVYELKERWAKATGKLALSMGKLTPGFKTLSKEANRWRGTMRGMTGDFHLGADMFMELSTTFETTGKHVKEFSQLNLQLARGFNLGGKGAGQLTGAMRKIGMSAGESTQIMGNMTVQAEMLGVNTQSLAKDLSESGDMLARFGKEGTKSLIQGSVFLKQFNIGLKDTNRLMDTFDRFDSASEATARLNTIFGTTISSMDMMLSQDPAERIEKIRTQLLAQGKTFDKLSYFERKSLEETMGVGAQELALLLDSRKAHISLAGFREKAAKKKATEAQAEKKMQKQLRATVQTMFDFGGAMDKITRAIGRALEPLLDAFGLGSKTGGKFGKTMGSITDEIVRWIDSGAKSKSWIKLMHDLADALKAAAKWISNITSSDITKWFGLAVGWTRKFVEYSSVLIGIWAGAKLIGSITRIAGLFGGMAKNMGKMGAGAGAIASRLAGRDGIGEIMDTHDVRSRGSRRLGKVGGGFRKVGGLLKKGITRGGGGMLGALGGAAAGMGLGHVTGGGSTGGTIGSGLGTVIGMWGGPIGMAVGGAVGGFLGKHVGKLFASAPKPKVLKEGEKITIRLNALKKEQIKLSEEANLAAAGNRLVERKIAQDRKQERKDLRAGGKEQGDAARQIAKRTLNMGLPMGKFGKRLQEISESNGPLDLNKREIRQMTRFARKSRKELDRLAESVAQNAGLEEAKAAYEMAKAKNEADIVDIDIAKNDASQLALDLKNKEGFVAQSGRKGLEVAGKVSTGKQISDLLTSGEFGAATDAINERASVEAKAIKHLKWRIAEEERNTLDASQAPAARKRQALAKTQLALTESSLIETNKLKAATNKASLAEENRFKFSIKETKLLKAKIDLQRLELAMKADLSGGFAAAMERIQSGDSASSVLDSGQLEIYKRAEAARGTLTNFAGGGIVNRPTPALIGEAGSEAVIPLKTLARGRGRQPNKFGGQAAKNLVNYASGGGGNQSASQQVQTITTDVTLDGEKVGRAVTRTMIGNGSL